MSWDFAPKIIEGETVLLEPLDGVAANDICEAMLPDPTGWYSVMFGLNSVEEYQKLLAGFVSYRQRRTGIGFAIRDRLTKCLAGISSFYKMDEENRSLEIGTTNIAPQFRRTHINTTAKLLMLTEAFEKMDCIRVSFRIDEENRKSREAILKIGAIEGGFLRYERILPDGRIRDYRFYSIIRPEWPAVKAKLEARLRRS